MKTTEVPFNLNDHVKVKLTPKGYRILEDLHRETFQGRPEFKYKKPNEDSDGWSKWQLWYLVRCFGKHIFMACEPPFETNIKIVIETGRNGGWTNDLQA